MARLKERPEISGDEEAVSRMIEIERDGGNVKSEMPHYRLELSRFLRKETPEDQVHIATAIKDERDRLAEVFPHEKELIQDYAMHAVASFNLISDSGTGFSKPQLSNWCLLLDRYPRSEEMSADLRGAIIELRRKILFDIVERTVKTTNQIRPAYLME